MALSDKAKVVALRFLSFHLCTGEFNPALESRDSTDRANAESFRADVPLDNHENIGSTMAPGGVRYGQRQRFALYYLRGGRQGTCSRANFAEGRRC